MKYILVAFLLLSSCGTKLQEGKNNEAGQNDDKKLTIDYRQPAHLDIDKDGLVDFTIAANVVSDHLVKRIDFVIHPKNGCKIGNPGVSQMTQTSSNISQPDDYWSQDSKVLVSRVFTNGPDVASWQGLLKKDNDQLIVKIRSGEKWYTGKIEFSTANAYSKLTIENTSFERIADQETVTIE